MKSMSWRSFQQDIKWKWNKWEQLLINLFLENSIYLENISWEHKHYDFILKYNELENNNNTLLIDFFKKIYKNKLNKKIEWFTVDSKNNLSVFNWNNYAFLETVNNWFMLGLKNKLYKLNSDKNERKWLNFIVINNLEHLEDFLNEWSENIEDNIQNNISWYLMHIPRNNKLNINNIKYLVLSLLNEINENYYQNILDLPDITNRINDKEYLIAINIYDYILKNPNKLIYLVYSLWWSLEEWINETDVIAFVSDKERKAILVNSNDILNYINSNYIKYINDNIYILSTSVNEMTKTSKSVWQSAFVSANINKLSNNTLVLEQLNK